MKLFLCLFFISIVNVYSSVDYDQVANETFRKLDNSVTIQIIPSTYKIDWSTPRNLIISLIKNKYYFPKTKSALGHVTAEVNCRIDGKKVRKFLGQTTKNLNGLRNHVISGNGFSVLNRPRNNYIEIPLLTVNGSLDNYPDSLEKFNRLIRKNHFGSITFKIGESNCKKAFDFMNEYEIATKNTKKAGNRYGFGADPKRFEGAGCATFVETVLDYAKVPNLAYWLEQTVYVPGSFLGNIDQGKKSSILDLVMSSENLIENTENTKKFSFPDPQVIFDRLNETLNQQGKFGGKELIFKKSLNSQVFAIGLDVSN